MQPVMVHNIDDYDTLQTLSTCNLLKNLKVTALLEMVCTTYQYVVCHACHTCTDIMHASYYGAYIDDYDTLQTLSTCNFTKRILR